jgi:hypothetical protein
LGAEAQDLGSTLKNLFPPSQVSGVDSVQPHAVTVLHHGDGIVTQPAKSPEVLQLLLPPCPSIRDVLDGVGRGLTEDAEATVRFQPLSAAFSVLLVLVVGPWPGERRRGALDGRLIDRYVKPAPDLERASSYNPRGMGRRVEGERNIKPDFSFGRRP